MRYRATVIAEVMLGNPSTVESKSLQLLNLFEHPPVEFRDRPVKLRHIGGQKVRAKFHGASDRSFLCPR